MAAAACCALLAAVLAGCSADSCADNAGGCNPGGGSAGMVAGAGAPGSLAGAGGGASGAPAGAGGTLAGGTGGSTTGQGGTAGGGQAAGSAGTAGVSGGAGSAQGGNGGSGTTGGTGGQPATELEPFSFFMTSFEAMQRLSQSEDGFGGDLRYGEADGLAGADKICTEIAEHSMPGAGAKGWRAFLSVAQGPDGEPVHAIERVGDGPWYDRLGRLVAMDVEALQNERPEGADPVIIEDLPNEYGVPNHRPDPTQPQVDNHHVLTGSNTMGELYMGDDRGTCADWTSTAQSAGRPRVGFSWTVSSRRHWISGQDEGGCGAGAVLTDGGGSDPSNPIVGSGGGYGGFYCFALMP